MASASSVAAALSSVLTAPEGEPAVKKAHTKNEGISKKMSPDNQAPFAVLSAMVETKLEQQTVHNPRYASWAINRLYEYITYFVYIIYVMIIPHFLSRNWTT